MISNLEKVGRMIIDGVDRSEVILPNGEWERAVPNTTAKGNKAEFHTTRAAVNLLNRPNGTYTAESTGSVAVSDNITTVNVQFTSAWSIYKLTGDVNNTNIAVSLSDMKAKSTEAVLFKNGHTYIVKLFDSANDYYDLQIANATTNMTITDGVSFTPTEDFNTLWTRMNADGRGSETGNKTFKIMIVEGTTAPTDYYPFFADTTVLASARAYGKSPVQNSANRPIGKTTKAIGPVPFSSVEAYEAYKKSMAYGETPTHKVGIYDYGKAIGTAPQTSESVKAGKYKTAQFMGKTVTKHKKPVLWGQYIPVEYIECTGTQWIDTDIIANNNTEAELDYAIGGASSVYIFGTRISGTQYFTISGSQTGGTNTNFVNGTSVNVDVGNRVSGSWNRLFQKVATNNGTVNWNATNKDTQVSKNGTYSATIPELSTTIKLFSNSTEFEAHGRIYSCKLKQNGTLVRDFVPVKDVVNNVYGMFDRVNNKFYGNAGTGEFSAGDEIKPVSYITNPRVKTSVKPNQDTKIKMKFRADTITTSIALIGARNSSSGQERNGVAIWQNVGSKMRFDYQSGSKAATDDYTANAWNIVEKDGVHNYLNGVPQGDNSSATFQCDYELTIGAINTGDTVSSGCEADIAEVYIDDVLYMPVKVGTSVYYLDTAMWTLLSGTGTAGAEIPYSTIIPDELESNVGPIKYGYADLDVNIPGDFQRVEYIESSGTQYIDTGFTFEDSTKIEFTITKTAPNEGYTDAESRGNVWFGNNGSTGTELMLGWGASGNQNYFRGSGSSGLFAGWKPSLNTKYHIEFTYEKGNGQLYVDGVKQGATATGTTSTDGRSILIGAARDQTTTILYCKEKFHDEVKMWNGDTLLCHLIPVKKGTEYGMYDLVSGQFFGNSGTGAFTGPTETINREIYTTGTQEMSIKSKNLFDITDTDYNASLWTYNLTTGVLTGAGADANFSIWHRNCKAGEKYTLSCYYDSIVNISNLQIRNSDNVTLLTSDNYSAGFTGAASLTFTVPSDGDYTFRIRCAGNSQLTCHNIQLEQGSTATPYSPYFAPQIYSNKNLLLSATSYMDFASREIYKDWAIKVLDGTEDWSVQSSVQYAIKKADLGTNSTILPTNSTDIICGRFDVSSTGSGSGIIWVGNNYVNFMDETRGTDLTGWKAKLAKWLADGDPLVLMYKVPASTTTDATLPEFTQNAGTSIIDNTDAYGTKQGVSVTGVHLNVLTPSPSTPLPLNTNAGQLYYSITATDTTKYPVTLNGWGRKVLNGTESWSGSAYFYTSIAGMKSLNYGLGFCSRFTARTSSSDLTHDVQFGSNSNYVYFFEKTSKPTGVTDAATWKAYLASNNVDLLYQLAASDNSVWTAASNTQGDIGYLCTTQGTATTSAPLGTFVSAKGMTVASVNGVITDGEQKFFIGSQGVVDMGTLNWSYANQRFSVNLENGGASTACFCTDSKYVIRDSATDKSLYKNSSFGVVVVYDSDYTDAASFKAAMSGKYLYYQRATDETYIPPYTGSIKTPLLSTNCYRDFSRKIDHNEWAIKVLDGTESWSYGGNSTGYGWYLGVSDLSTNKGASDIVCTHFPARGVFSYANNPSIGYFAASDKYITLRYDDCLDGDSTKKIKAYLAAEYAAGHPVVIAYPLATPTETSITVTSPTQNAGTNTVDTVFADATHGNVEMDGIMQLQTVPMPESSLPIETSSGTLNWNSTTQELETDGEQKLEIRGKNIWNLGDFINGAGTQKTLEGLDPNKTYTVLVKASSDYSTDSTAWSASPRNADGSSRGNLFYMNNYVAGQTVSAEFTGAAMLRIQGTNFSGSFYVCLVEGTATTYEPYIQPKVVDIKTILLSEDDYEDVNAKLAHNAWKAVVLDGTEEVTAALSEQTPCFKVFKNFDPPTYTSQICCSHYQYEQVFWAGPNKYGKCSFGTGVAGNLPLWLSADGITTVNDFKAYLAAKYAAGNPAIILYPLATATDTAISTTPIALDKKATWVATNTTELGAGDVQLTYLGK